MHAGVGAEREGQIGAERGMGGLIGHQLGLGGERKKTRELVDSWWAVGAESGANKLGAVERIALKDTADHRVESGRLVYLHRSVTTTMTAHTGTIRRMSSPISRSVSATVNPS